MPFLQEALNPIMGRTMYFVIYPIYEQDCGTISHIVPV